eukprot:tig00021326_g20311.t1
MRAVLAGAAARPRSARPVRALSGAAKAKPARWERLDVCETVEVGAAEQDGKLRIPGESLQVVMLEGEGGVDKRSLLNRLRALGYAVHSAKYMDFCAQHREEDPTGPAMALRWAAASLNAVDALQRRAREEPGAFRGSLAFVDRSPLAPAAFAAARGRAPDRLLLDAAAELRAARRCSLLLCTADAYATNRALSFRYEQAGPVERALRERLGERDPEFLARVREAYGELRRGGAFDAALDNSHPKLATIALLRMLGVRAFDGLAPPPPHAPPA